MEWIIFAGAGAAVVVITLIVLIIKLQRNHKQDQEGLYWQYQDEWLKDTFNNFDVGVYGLRGSGKDVLFNHVINLIGGKHYSNIVYNSLTEVRDLKDLNVGGNQYPDFIEGTTHKFEPNFEENFHYYISDAGVYLGCQFNRELNANYSEMPIHMALRRHMYNSHVHTNSQALNRPWDKLREQQGVWLHTLGTEDYGEFLIVTAISYTRYESALECLPPSEREDKYYTMKYGEIKEHKFKVPVDSLTYDTRHFKTQLLIQTEEVNEHERATIII